MISCRPPHSTEDSKLEYPNSELHESADNKDISKLLDETFDSHSPLKRKYKNGQNTSNITPHSGKSETKKAPQTTRKLTRGDGETDISPPRRRPDLSFLDDIF